MKDWENKLDIAETLLLGEEDLRKKDELIEAHFVGVGKLIRKQRQKMAKALRKEEIKIPNQLNDSGKLGMGYNLAIREFNQKLDSYLKKQEGG